MAISYLYNKTASVTRLGTGAKRDFEVLHASVPCHIQPLAPSTQSDMAGNFGKDILMMCAPIDIREKDRVTIDGVEYRVMGVELLRSIVNSNNAHAEIMLRAFV